MIEPILSLSLTMHANPGVYAILVGSGVSRSANIPTGWEIVLDLARKLATMHNEDCEPDPAAWYHDKYGKDPDYAELLNELAKSPTERQQLLRSYFEPTDEEREQGQKQPTTAHRAIAKLVASGYCKLILTTNFDRLIERALEDEGVTPSVVASPDAVKGMLPLEHQRCCVVKLHGDYLDTRILNTPDELSAYHERMNQLLDQVFDNFGLIVCGWSGQWDPALRAAFERCPSRRFTTYWASRGKPTDEASRLITHRAAEQVQIDDADSFFQQLSEQVLALKDSRRAHPVSVEAAVALAKHYLSDARYRIKLEELISHETETTHGRIQACHAKAFETQAPLGETFQQYRDHLELLQAVMINGVWYGARPHDRLWASTIQRLAGYENESRTSEAACISQYPGLVLLYSCGLAATGRQRYETLLESLVGPKLRKDGETRLLLNSIEYNELDQKIKAIDSHETHSVPTSQHLFTELREPLRPFIPDDAEYDDVFDRFELLRSLAFAHIEYETVGKDDRCCVPLGRFSWKTCGSLATSILRTVRAEVDERGEDWPPLRAGLLDGSADRARELLAGIERFVLLPNLD